MTAQAPGTPRLDHEPAVHALSVSAVLEHLSSSRHGLAHDEAALRLERFGPNRLNVVAAESAVTILIRQFKSVVVLLLAAAAAVALFMGDLLEGGAIGVVLLLNAVIGFVTEYRARRAMAALLALDVPRAVVLRDGQPLTVDAHTLVPGDIALLRHGQHIPADGRVIDSADLRIDEAPLTGESMPVSKRTEPMPTETPLADRVNMAYKGTLVAAGVARIVVTATGMQTEIGRVGLLTASVKAEPTPLERRLDELGHRLVWLALGAGAFVAILEARQGTAFPLVIETGIALAVAAVPEALPAVATIALAVGVRRMSARRALVRRLPAVEALGSTTVICTDKTRTLTSGTMTVARVWTTGGEFILSDGSEPARSPALERTVEIAALASQPQSEGAVGGEAAEDPVDVAILRLAVTLGISRPQLEHARPTVGLLPFSSERKLAASFHRQGADTVAYVKGSPQHVLAKSHRTDGGHAIDEHERRRLLAVNEQLARQGLRVLALASGSVDSTNEAALTNLTFAGFIGLMDPPAAGVKETVTRLKAAGLRLVMLTGDQRATAEAVGRDVGVLSGDTRVVGVEELDTMSAETLEREVAGIGAFSRIAPSHKLAIVRALQARGEIVAMIGDGINDAAALRQADVGVAMGRRGTDVAKEAAAIVLQDDRLETIATAVEEGRVIFDNIRKFVFYLFSCNVGEVFMLSSAGIAGLPLPLAPLQLLWLNMVTDTFPAFALAIEPGDRDVMHRPPRNPSEAVLSGAFVRRIVLWGAAVAGFPLAAFLFALQTSPETAVSVAFTTLAFAQIFHLGNARSPDPILSLEQAMANRHAVAAIIITVGLQLAALYIPPLAAALHLVPLGWSDWLIVLPCAIAPAVIGQILKLTRIRLKPDSTTVTTG